MLERGAGRGTGHIRVGGRGEKMVEQHGSVSVHTRLDAVMPHIGDACVAAMETFLFLIQSGVWSPLGLITIKAHHQMLCFPSLLGTPWSLGGAL